MNSNHRVPVVRITDILPHPNADRLEIIHIGGYQVVVGKGQFVVGDLAVYIQPDSVLPDKPQYAFVWARDGAGNLRILTPETEIPEKWRRITVRKFRKEWSEGLLMPFPELPEISDGIFPDDDHINEGDDVAEVLGIEHYNPPEPEDTAPTTSRKQSRVFPRSLKGWLHFASYWGTFGLYNPWGDTNGFGNEKAPENTPPMYDVETYKNYTDTFAPTDEVVITEKIHGSNARYTYRPAAQGFWQRLTGSSGKMYAGSRKLWKAPTSSTVWRKVLQVYPQIETWAKANPGYTLYGEVTPTQKDFDYGGTSEHPKFFAFDIRTPDGQWAEWVDYWAAIQTFNIPTVPFIYRGEFRGVDLEFYVSGKTLTGASHIREGIVIKTTPEKNITGLGRAQLKIVSNEYLEKTK